MQCHTTLHYTPSHHTTRCELSALLLLLLLFLDILQFDLTIWLVVARSSWFFGKTNIRSGGKELRRGTQIEKRKRSVISILFNSTVYIINYIRIRCILIGFIFVVIFINRQQANYFIVYLYDEIFQNINCKLFLPLSLTRSLSISLYQYFSPRSGRECTQFENISIRWGYEFKAGHTGRIEEIVCPGVCWICTSKRYVREFIINPSGLL